MPVCKLLVCERTLVFSPMTPTIMGGAGLKSAHLAWSVFHFVIDRSRCLRFTFHEPVREAQIIKLLYRRVCLLKCPGLRLFAELCGLRFKVFQFLKK